MASRSMRSSSSTPDIMPLLKSTLMQRSLRRELKSLRRAWNTCIWYGAHEPKAALLDKRNERF